MTTFEQQAQADAESEARMQSFRDQLAAMRVPGSRPQRDKIMGIVGLVAMVVAIVLAIAAYFMSHGTTNALEQNDAIVLAILAATIAVVGVGLFLKNSLERLLRFWIARVTFEQSAQTDRLIAQGAELHELMRQLARQRDASGVG